MSNQQVVIIGPPHHGKTEVRKYICEVMGWKGASTSDVIYALLAQEMGKPEAELRAMPKEEIRPKLIEFGDYLCGKAGKLELVPPLPERPAPEKYYRGPSALSRILFHTGHRVSDGIRRRLELSDLRSKLEWLGIPLVVIWVERPGHPTIKDNTEVTSADADFVLLNDGSLEELRSKVKAWLDSLELRPKAE